jgi:hypothetical protein
MIHSSKYETFINRVCRLHFIPHKKKNTLSNVYMAAAQRVEQEMKGVVSRREATT